MKVGTFNGVSVRVLKHGQPVEDTITCPYCKNRIKVASILESPTLKQAHETAERLAKCRRERKTLKQKIKSRAIKLEEALFTLKRIQKREERLPEAWNFVVVERCPKCFASLGAFDVNIRVVEPQTIFKDTDFINLEVGSDYLGRTAEQLGFPSAESFKAWWNGEDLKRPKEVIEVASSLDIERADVPGEIKQWALQARAFNLNNTLINRRLKTISRVRNLLPKIMGV